MFSKQNAKLFAFFENLRALGSVESVCTILIGFFIFERIFEDSSFLCLSVFCLYFHRFLPSPLPFCIGAWPRGYWWEIGFFSRSRRILLLRLKSRALRSFSFDLSDSLRSPYPNYHAYRISPIPSLPFSTRLLVFTLSSQLSYKSYLSFLFNYACSRLIFYRFFTDILRISLASHVRDFQIYQR